MNKLRIFLCAILTIAALNTFAQVPAARMAKTPSGHLPGLGNNGNSGPLGNSGMTPNPSIGSGQCPPPGGNDTLPPDTPPRRDDGPTDETDIPVFTPLDPNEIVGTRGYDTLGDTLQWVAATASLPYTIYFENDPELATAAAQKVEVRHRLHAKADISTFAIGAFGFGSHVSIW